MHIVAPVIASVARIRRWRNHRNRLPNGFDRESAHISGTSVITEEFEMSLVRTICLSILELSNFKVLNWKLTRRFFGDAV